jgi:hypothetical protein
MRPVSLRSTETGCCRHPLTAGWGATICLTATTAFAGTDLRDVTLPQRVHGFVLRKDLSSWTETIAGRDFEIQPLSTSYNGDTGLFHLSTAEVVPRHKIGISLHRDNVDRNPRNVDLSTFGLSVTFGLVRRLEIFAGAGLHTRMDVDGSLAGGALNDYPRAGLAAPSPGWQTGPGDVRLGVKLKVIEHYGAHPLAAAVRTAVKLPTADYERGLGTGTYAFEIGLLGSFSVAQRIQLSAMGTLIPDNGAPDRPSSDAVVGGAGFALRMGSPLQLQGEIVGTWHTQAHSQPYSLDVVIGPALWFRRGIFVRPALSSNLHFAATGRSSTSSHIGLHFSIGFHPGVPFREVFELPPVSPPLPPPSPSQVQGASQK